MRRGLLDIESLTRPGQNRRLRALAIDALRQYDLDLARCSFVDRAFNTVFRADATDGTAHALRVSPSFRIHADGCEVAEAAWLEALRRDADLPVPRVIPARDGSVVVWASSDGVPDARSCVLFDGLVDGTLPRNEVYHFLQLGRYLERANQMSRILNIKMHGLRDGKYWPPVSRIDGGYGDRNLVCACPPPEAFEER